MRRYLLTSLMAALAVALSLTASQTWGQGATGPLSGAVPNTERAIGNAEHQAAGAAGATVSPAAKIPPAPLSAEPNSTASNANAGANAKQEGDARNDTAVQAGPAAIAPADPPVVVNVAGARADRWRYRLDNGRWWYWTPENRWMWYSDNGGWVYYEPAVPAVPYTTAYGSYDVVPGTGYYYPSYGTYYYPGYWRGRGYYYRPGVSIGVGGIGIGIGPSYGYRGGRRW